MSAETGARLIGRYEVHGVLASGGMALVHMGRLRGAQGFAKPVAVKRLHAQYATDPEFVSSLLEEAHLSERIRHPNVVATLDVVAEAGELLLVMEYVHGETLARLLRACAEQAMPCPPAIAAAIAHGVLLGLDAAYRTVDPHGHPLHVVHRDVSPQNILVGADGTSRLLDFGIAKAASSASHTREGHVRGKVPYMAPEQLRFQPATHQTDVYSLAVVLWETLCAQRLFRAGSDMEVWGQVLNAEIRAPSEVLGEPVALDAVVMRGLARDPALRYASALEMAQDIERSTRLASPTDVATWVTTLAREPLEQRSAMLRAVETAPALTTGTMRGPGNDPRPASLTTSPTVLPATTVEARRSHAPTAILLALLALLLVGGGAIAVNRWRTRAAAAATRAPVVAVTEPSAVATVTSSTPLAAPPPVPEATTVAVASSSGPSVTPSHRPSGRKLPARATATTAAEPPAPTRPGADPCDPPFYVDEAGRKHFKLDCVAGK